MAQFSDERCGACDHDVRAHWMPVDERRSGLPNPASACRCQACPPERRCQGFVKRQQLNPPGEVEGGG